MEHNAEGDTRRHHERPSIDGPCILSSDGWCYTCSTSEGPVYHPVSRVFPPKGGNDGTPQ